MTEGAKLVTYLRKLLGSPPVGGIARRLNHHKGEQLLFSLAIDNVSLLIVYWSYRDLPFMEDSTVQANIDNASRGNLSAGANKLPIKRFPRFGFFSLLLLLAIIITVLATFLLDGFESPLGKSKEPPKDLITRTGEAGLIDPTNKEKILVGNFKDTRPGLEENAEAERSNKFRIYLVQFDFLLTRYYAGDEEALGLAREWKQMMEGEFPELYKDAEEKGYLDIVEI